MDQNITEVALFKLEPDFIILSKYVFIGKNQREIRQHIDRYKRAGSIVELPFASASDEDYYANGIVSVVNKYALQGHGVNLSYLIFSLFKSTYQTLTEVEIPSTKIFETVAQLEELTNFLLKHKSQAMRIRIEAIPDKPLVKKDNKIVKVSKPHVSIDDHELTSWVVRHLIKSVQNGNYPINWSHQLFKSNIVQTENGERLRLHPNSNITSASYQTLITDAISTLCIPILNYLEHETDIKKGNAKHWSYPQLSVLIEVLILVGYYKSSVPFFKLGESSPSTKDKRYLDSTLQNKLNQNKILINNPIQVTL